MVTTSTQFGFMGCSRCAGMEVSRVPRVAKSLPDTVVVLCCCCVVLHWVVLCCVELRCVVWHCITAVLCFVVFVCWVESPWFDACCVVSCYVASNTEPHWTIVIIVVMCYIILCTSEWRCPRRTSWVADDAGQAFDLACSAVLRRVWLCTTLLKTSLSTQAPTKPSLAFMIGFHFIQRFHLLFISPPGKHCSMLAYWAKLSD